MGKCCRLVLYVAVGVAAWIGFGVYRFLQPVPAPHLPQDTWWGPGKPQKEDVSIKPFKVNVPDKVLETLKVRLESTVLTPPLEGINFEYGFNTDTLKKIVDFWKTKYNWRQREVFLNQLPQFTTNVQGLDMHYIHVKPKVDKNTKVYPLLILHGWPGSVREFYDVIPMLTTKQNGYDFVFEVIAPSLPGFIFSQGASKPGLGAAQISVVMKNLMARLGLQQFYVQGGDWGSIIARNLASLYPDNVLGHHSNFCTLKTSLSYMQAFLGSFAPSLFVAKEHEAKIFPMLERFFHYIQETGYLHIQATKPDTIGVALVDSPVGIAAYILEKFSTGTNPTWITAKDGGLLSKYKYEDLLDFVMLYYVTNSMTTAVRLYAETFSSDQRALQLERVHITVPSACAKFPYEIDYQTDWQLRQKYVNLVQSTDMPRGGHFAAFEEPRLLADDVFAATVKFIEFNAKKNVSNVKVKKTEI